MTNSFFLGFSLNGKTKRQHIMMKMKTRNRRVNGHPLLPRSSLNGITKASFVSQGDRQNLSSRVNFLYRESDSWPDKSPTHRAYEMCTSEVPNPSITTRFFFRRSFSSSVSICLLDPYRSTRRKTLPWLGSCENRGAETTCFCQDLPGAPQPLSNSDERCSSQCTATFHQKLHKIRTTPTEMTSFFQRDIPASFLHVVPLTCDFWWRHSSSFLISMQKPLSFLCSSVFCSLAMFSLKTNSCLTRMVSFNYNQPQNTSDCQIFTFTVLTTSPCALGIRFGNFLMLTHSAGSFGSWTHFQEQVNII